MSHGKGPARGNDEFPEDDPAPVVSTDPVGLTAGLAGLSVNGGGAGVDGGAADGAGAAGGAAGASGSGGSPSENSVPIAEQIAALQQDNDNLAGQLSVISATLQQLVDARQQGAAQAGGPVVAPGSGLDAGAAASPGSAADRERRAAKADFESNASAWRSGRTVWTLRSLRGFDLQSKETLKTVMAGFVECTDKVWHQLRYMSGFNVLEFFPDSERGEMSVADHFDMTCAAILRVLKFGLAPSVPEQAAALERLQPLETAMQEAQINLRMQLLRHHGAFSGQASRDILAGIPNEDFRQWSNEIMTWMLPLQHLSTAPANFDQFPPPPVPAFTGIASFATSGSHLIRMFAARSGGGAPVAGTKRRASAPADGGGKRRRQVCFKYRDKGSCRFGDSCRYRHDHGAADGGDAGARRGRAGASGRSDGGGGASGTGGGSGGGGRTGSGTSSALGVRDGST
ncbi:unnamed protein product [Ectocarpus sp. CCAP 1310/34]|nr:unnamed protein product [Ectocarpus sp. CCAP 1310/34]